MFSQSVNCDMDTAQLSTGNDIAGQNGSLLLRGCFGNTNECGMERHAMDTACNTVPVEKENRVLLLSIRCSR